MASTGALAEQVTSVKCRAGRPRRRIEPEQQQLGGVTGNRRRRSLAAARTRCAERRVQAPRAVPARSRAIGEQARPSPVAPPAQASRQLQSAARSRPPSARKRGGLGVTIAVAPDVLVLAASASTNARSAAFILIPPGD